MSNKNTKDNQYTFTSPIRYYKTNDPYYFEIDNVPIKQLEENCLWLKDQILNKIEDDSQTLSKNIKRSEFNELKPYTTGEDRILRVKPGRFSARINDVYSKESLQSLSKILADSPDSPDTFIFETNNTFGFNSVLKNVLNKFKSSLGSDALGMTGLEERAFTWPIKNPDYPINATASGNIFNSLNKYFGYAGIDSDLSKAIGYSSSLIVSGVDFIPGLISEALLWLTSENLDKKEYQNFEKPIEIKKNYKNDYSYLYALNIFMSKLPVIETNLIKKWRGVTRFAIVDVPEELTIEIPEFDSTDFNFIDQDGEEKSTNNIKYRIDLIFLYGKPVDASGARVVKNNKIATIIKPEIGLFRGAGIKFNDYTDNLANFLVDTPVSAVDSNGTPTMLASPGDQNNETIGFFSSSSTEYNQDVKGSFPAPDDLLNITPLLSENLESEALELLGQSILPIAYVLVKDKKNTIYNSISPIKNSDVIDIRPFFRTAELSYNERAGIAGAVPQLSLANPAVGKEEFNAELVKFKESVEYNLLETENKLFLTKIPYPVSVFLDQKRTVFENIWNFKAITSTPLQNTPEYNLISEFDLGIDAQSPSVIDLSDIITPEMVDFDPDINTNPYDNLLSVNFQLDLSPTVNHFFSWQANIPNLEGTVSTSFFVYGGPTDSSELVLGDYSRIGYFPGRPGASSRCSNFVSRVNKDTKETFIQNIDGSFTTFQSPRISIKLFTDSVEAYNLIYKKKSGGFWDTFLGKAFQYVNPLYWFFGGSGSSSKPTASYMVDYFPVASLYITGYTYLKRDNFS